MKCLYYLIDTDIRKPVPIPKDLMERYGTYNEYVSLKYLKLKPSAKASWEKNLKFSIMISIPTGMSTTAYTPCGVWRLYL